MPKGKKGKVKRKRRRKKESIKAKNMHVVFIIAIKCI